MSPSNSTLTNNGSYIFSPSTAKVRTVRPSSPMPPARSTGPGAPPPSPPPPAGPSKPPSAKTPPSGSHWTPHNICTDVLVDNRSKSSKDKQLNRYRYALVRHQPKNDKHKRAKPCKGGCKICCKGLDKTSAHEPGKEPDHGPNDGFSRAPGKGLNSGPNKISCKESSKSPDNGLNRPTNEDKVRDFIKDVQITHARDRRHARRLNEQKEQDELREALSLSKAQALQAQFDDEAARKRLGSGEHGEDRTVAANGGSRHQAPEPEPTVSLGQDDTGRPCWVVTITDRRGEQRTYPVAATYTKEDVQRWARELLEDGHNGVRHNSPAGRLTGSTLEASSSGAGSGAVAGHARTGSARYPPSLPPTSSSGPHSYPSTGYSGSGGSGSGHGASRYSDGSRSGYPSSRYSTNSGYSSWSSGSHSP